MTALVLLGYSLLMATANHEHGHGTGGPHEHVSPTGSIETEIQLGADRARRNAVHSAGEIHAHNSNSMEESSSTHHAETRVKREEDDDTPLHDPNEEQLATELDNNTEAVNTENGTRHEESASTAAGSKEEVQEHAEEQSSTEQQGHVEQNAQENASGEKGAMAEQQTRSEVHHHEGQQKESLESTTMPSGKRRRRRKRENPEKEPFGSAVKSAPAEDEENAHEHGEEHSHRTAKSVEMKKGEEASLIDETQTGASDQHAHGANEHEERQQQQEHEHHENHENATIRPVRSIGLGHRARSQSVQKNQQQAGRGPKSENGSTEVET